tara:strand:- start:88 stop:288 length:201 start_codon:yes stop_codon:yes gene_type:complete
MKTPNQIKADAERFTPDAWKQFTVAELSMWAHLLRKRAGMRTEPHKAAKDRIDADNYEAMMHEALK